MFRLWIIIFTQERAPAAPSVSAFDFEQVNVCWVPPYQCIKDETTYCCNYRQMYKNLSENSSSVKAVIKSSCSLKNVFSLQVTVFSRREQFFQSTVSLYFIKVVATIHSHELRIYNVFDRYFKGIGLIRDSSCSH